MALESGEKHTLEQAIAGALQAGLGTEEGSMLADAQEELVIMEAEEAEERALKQAARAQEQEKIKLASLQVRTNTSTAREFAQSGSTSTATTQFVEIELYLLALRIVEYSEGRGADCRDAGGGARVLKSGCARVGMLCLQAELASMVDPEVEAEQARRKARQAAQREEARRDWEEMEKRMREPGRGRMALTLTAAQPRQARGARAQMRPSTPRPPLPGHQRSLRKANEPTPGTYSHVPNSPAQPSPAQPTHVCSSFGYPYGCAR